MANDMSDFEDLSDLDNQILGGFSNKETKLPKKTVKFNESSNDILSDLLSENNSPKRQTLSSVSKNTRVTNLFGLGSHQNLEEIKPNLSISPDQNKSLESEKSQKVSNETQRQNIIKSILTEHDNIAKSKTSIDSNEIKKSDEDFLALRSRPSTGDNILSQNISDFEAGFNVTDTNKTSSNFEYSPTRKRKPRRGRSNTSSAILDDPLGLFSTRNNDKVESDNIKDPLLPNKDIFTIYNKQDIQKNNIQDLPEWLGGSSETLKQDNAEQQKGLPSYTLKTTNNTETFQNLNIKNVENVENELKLSDTILPLNVQTDQLSILSAMQNDMKTAASLFQQYEQLGNILESQKMKWIEQEKQFNELVKKQMEGQVFLDTQLKMQQGRINNCLQTLLLQSSSIPTFSLSNNKTLNQNNEPFDKESEAEILVKKLEIEKLQLEETLKSFKDVHEKEIVILDQSYRKQIQYLEESLEKLENRLKRDAETLEENFEIRLQQMKEKMFDLEKAHEEEKEQIKMENKKLVQEICARHTLNVEFLQKEYTDTIENISKTKKLEQTVIDLITTRGTDISKILDNSETAISNLIKLQEQIEKHDNKFFELKESAIKKQESQLESLKEQLQDEKDALEIDRKKFIAITEKFELEVSRMTFEFQNRMVQLVEMENTLKLRENAIIRDRELLMEQSKWEHSNIQALKDMWDKEQVKQAEMIAKEREDIAIERGKLVVLNKLQIKSDNVDKAELESSINAAKEATELIVRERKMWQDRIAELETQRNILLEKENQLVQKAKHLEDLTQLAIVKRNEGIEALKNAHRIERIYKEKFQQLQVQLEVLDERENKIAAEKIELAREKINLRLNDIEIPEKNDKSFKNYSENLMEKSYLIENYEKSQIQTHFKDIVDPRLLLLKINLNNKLTAYE